MASTRNAIDRILQATDLHFWHVETNPLRLLNKRLIGNANVIARRSKEFLTHRADAIFEYLTSLGIQDLVLSGDFTSTALDSEFEAAAQFVDRLEQAGLRPVAIPGNHDVYTFESVRRGRFANHMGRWMPAETLPAVQHLPGGTPVMYVPTVCPNLLSSAGHISEMEVAAAGTLLDSLPGPVIVVGHYPVLDETVAYHVGRNRRLRNGESLRRALGDSGKRILYVCGHVHRFSLERDPAHENLVHLSSAALFRKDPDTGHAGDFSEVHVDSDGFRVIRHRYNGAWKAESTTPD